MKKITDNKTTIKSIWKQDNLNPATDNHDQARHRQAYRDPTAILAIGNILREERKTKRKKRRIAKQNRRS